MSRTVGLGPPGAGGGIAGSGDRRVFGTSAVPGGTVENHPRAGLAPCLCMVEPDPGRVAPTRVGLGSSGGCSGAHVRAVGSVLPAEIALVAASRAATPGSMVAAHRNDRLILAAMPTCAASGSREGIWTNGWD